MSYKWHGFNTKTIRENGDDDDNDDDDDDEDDNDDDDDDEVRHFGSSMLRSRAYALRSPLCRPDCSWVALVPSRLHSPLGGYLLLVPRL